MVSATPSGGWLQSSPVIPDLGWPLTPRAEMFVLDKRSPNVLRPGKRPRVTLTPSLAYRNGTPYMVFGTPGGDQQDQWALHMFLRHVQQYISQHTRCKVHTKGVYKWYERVYTQNSNSPYRVGIRPTDWRVVGAYAHVVSLCDVVLFGA